MYKKLFILFIGLFIGFSAYSDVTVPSGTRNDWSHRSLNRNDLYLVDNLYLADDSSNTMCLRAPDLADDNTVFQLPSDNGTSGYVLITDGNGITSWDDINSLTGLTPTNNYFIVGDGSNWATETPVNVKTSLGLSTADDVTFRSTTISGTGGQGFVHFYHQSSDPSTPGSGTDHVRLFAKSKKLYTAVDDGAGTAIITEVGTGANTGINYIENSDAEGAATTGYATYADAASEDPTDGTGGTATSTLAASASSPLRGSYSFLFSKPASNEQGEGFSYDLTVDSADLANVLEISFDYSTTGDFDASADNTTASSIVVWVYNKDSSVLIQPSTIVLDGSGKFSAYIQTDSSDDDYRIIWHVADDTSSAFTFKADNISFSPVHSVQGVPASDWTSFTPTWNNVTVDTGNGGSEGAMWRRVGDSMEIRAFFSLGTSTGDVTGSISLDLPSGYSIDTTKKNWNFDVLGSAWAYDASGTSGDNGTVRLNGSDQIVIVGNGVDFDATDPFDWTASDHLSLQFTVPISGWGANVAMSHSANTRELVERASLTANQTFTTATPATIGTSTNLTIDRSTHSALSTSGVFTAPYAKEYYITGSIDVGSLSSDFNGTEYWAIKTYVDTVEDKLVLLFMPNTTETQRVLSFSASVYLEAGQTLELKGLQNSGANKIMAAANTYFVISDKPGPATIAASEVITCRAYLNSATNHGTSGSWIKVPLDTVTHDDHGWFDTVNNRYIVGVPGKYEIKGLASFDANATGVRNTAIAIDGARTANGGTVSGDATYGSGAVIFDQQDLAAGQYIELFGFQSSGGSLAYTNDERTTYLVVKRIGGIN